MAEPAASGLPFIRSKDLTSLLHEGSNFPRGHVRPIHVPVKMFMGTASGLVGTHSHVNDFPKFLTKIHTYSKRPRGSGAEDGVGDH